MVICLLPSIPNLNNVNDSYHMNIYSVTHKKVIIYPVYLKINKCFEDDKLPFYISGNI